MRHDVVQRMLANTNSCPCLLRSTQTCLSPALPLPSPLPPASLSYRMNDTTSCRWCVRLHSVQGNQRSGETYPQSRGTDFGPETSFAIHTIHVYLCKYWFYIVHVCVFCIIADPSGSPPEPGPYSESVLPVHGELHGTSPLRCESSRHS